MYAAMRSNSSQFISFQGTIAAFAVESSMHRYLGQSWPKPAKCARRVDVERK